MKNTTNELRRSLVIKAELSVHAGCGWSHCWGGPPGHCINCFWREWKLWIDCVNDFKLDKNIVGVYFFFSLQHKHFSRKRAAPHVSRLIVFQSVQMRSDDLLWSTLCMNYESKQCVPSNATGDQCLDWPQFKKKKKEKETEKLAKVILRRLWIPFSSQEAVLNKAARQPLHLNSSYFLIAFITRLLRSLNWLL